MSSDRTASPEDRQPRLPVRAHPWHGVPIGRNAPDRVVAYIEIVPTDTIKYELDKETGYLKVDRPQKYSNVCPSLYGLIPRTYCGPRVAERAVSRTGEHDLRGDGDPLDICVLTENPFTHGDVLLTAIPIGGLAVIDMGEADDKIVAVLDGDAAYGELRDISECPPAILERLKHYFLTYKLPPDETDVPISIAGVYGRGEAHDVIRRAQADYAERYGDLGSGPTDPFSQRG